MRMKLTTRFDLAWCAFMFVWRNLKGFDEPTRGDPFKFVVEGVIR